MIIFTYQKHLCFKCKTQKQFCDPYFLSQNNVEYQVLRYNFCKIYYTSHAIYRARVTQC